MWIFEVYLILQSLVLKVTIVNNVHCIIKYYLQFPVSSVPRYSVYNLYFPNLSPGPIYE